MPRRKAKGARSPPAIGPTTKGIPSLPINDPATKPVNVT
jgi:hypothetical protein